MLVYVCACVRAHTAVYVPTNERASTRVYVATQITQRHKMQASLTVDTEEDLV